MARLRHFLRAAAALCLFAMLVAAPARAQDDVRLVEQDIKAGLLYNFLRYTEWPTLGEGNIMVCVYGRDPFGGRLEPMARRTVNQRRIEVRNVRAAAQTGACTLLFINAEESEQWPGLRTQLARAGVLTVSDFEGFAASGGMIEFTRNGQRIGVTINTRAVNSANLVVQDRLLRLANTIDAPARR